MPRTEWVTATEQTYEAIIDEVTWTRVQALIAADSRSRTDPGSQPPRRVGVRRADPSRYPLAGLVFCDCCKRRLQGNTARGHAFYRCSMSGDYPIPLNNHPRSLAVREDRLLPHVDAWIAQIFAPEQIDATAREVVQADHESHREDAAVTQARRTIIDCQRKIARHLDGLEAGIAADIIAPRMDAAQREKAAAEAVLTTAPPAPDPLTLDEVTDTLSTLRDMPEILATVEQSDRAALYQALGLTVTYRRTAGAEEVQLSSSPRGVELKRVEGSICYPITRPVILQSGWSELCRG